MHPGAGTAGVPVGLAVALPETRFETSAAASLVS